jgi:radical SAM superfamily enzyme YgiQ (UPF0313 family)
MRVMFVDPPGPAFGLSIGLGILSAVLKREGHQVLVTDLNNRRFKDFSKLRVDIERFKPELIGISIHATKYGAAHDVVKFVRSLSNAPIVAGGPQVSADMERILEECPEIDFLVYGEAEDGIKEIIERIEHKAGLEGINGVIFRKGEKIIRNHPRELVKDINLLPFPDFEAGGVKQICEYPILTSRGCPYNCIFCFSHIGRRWRERNPDNVIEELKEAREKFSINSFGVWDPVFNLTTKHVVNFCSLLIKENLNLPWNCYSVRADRVAEEQARMMKESGCQHVFMGVETLDDEIMKRINKKEKVEDVKKAVEIYHKHGLKVTGFFILGLPGDTFNKSVTTCEEAIGMGFDDQVWSHLTPYPGTAVLEWVKEKGNILLDYRCAPTGSREVIFETPDYSREDREKAMEIIQWKLSHWPVVVSPGYPQIFRLFLVLSGILRFDTRNIFRHLKKLFLFLTGQIKAAATTNVENIIFRDID